MSEKFGAIMGFARRLASVPSALQYDYIYIHREAISIGPPVIAFLLVNAGRTQPSLVK